jgi:GT2 family glycosyltransferase
MRRCEDTDLNLRLALAGGAFLRIADPLVTQHLTPGADKDGEAEIAGWRHLLAKHRAFLVEEQLWGFARRWLTLRFALWRQQYGRAALAALRLLLRHPFRTGARLGAALRNRSTGWRR